MAFNDKKWVLHFLWFTKGKSFHIKISKAFVEKKKKLFNFNINNFLFLLIFAKRLKIWFN